VDRGGQHVELLGVGVLGAVVLARVGAEHLLRHQPRLGYERLEFLGGLEVDHQTSSAPSIRPAARRSRYHRSTGCSLTYPWPPSNWTPSEPICIPRSAHSRRASATSRPNGLPWSARLAAR